jgi:NAD(P)-dependent dehydrogenase (short-subunit alcohol dehydrogenase family)
MKEKGEGYIINITDVESSHTGPHHPAYAASKWALAGFSHACYEALRPYGIKVGFEWFSGSW